MAQDIQGIAHRLLPAGDPRLAELAKRRPARVLLDLLGCYALIVLGFVLLARVDALWAQLLAFVMIGTRQHALTILGHDGKHGNLLRSRRANDLLAHVFVCAPVGADFNGERSRHMTHHRHFGAADDPDRPLYIASNKATLTTFLRFVLGLSSFGRSAAQATRKVDRPGLGPWPIRFLRRRWPSLLAQMVIFGVIASLLSWWMYFAFWVLPNFLLMYLPGKLRMFCEHAQIMLPDEAADDHRLVTYRPGLLERFFLSPFNMHLHAEHHLWMHVPYHSLPALRAVVADAAEIEVRGSFAGFLWRYARSLPLTKPASRPVVA